MIIVLIGALLIVALCLIVVFRKEKQDKETSERLCKYYEGLTEIRESIYELFDNVVVLECDKTEAIKMVKELRKDIDILWYDKLCLMDIPKE